MRILLIVIMLAILIPVSASSAQTGMYMTPFGAVKTNRIIEVPNGALVTGDGSVMTVYKSEADFLAGNKFREVAKPGTLQPPDLTGWLACSRLEDVPRCTTYTSYWYVPAEPEYYNYYATEFYFTGIQDNPVTAILQPVMEWNQTGHREQFIIRAWYWNPVSPVLGPPIDCETGDQIVGEMWKTTYLGMDVWACQITNMSTGYFSTVMVAESEFPFDDLDLFCTLEVKGISIEECRDLMGGVRFNSITILNGSTPIPAPWDTYVMELDGVLDVVTAPNGSWVDIVVDCDDPVTADFYGTPTSGNNLPMTVQFYDQSTNAENWFWSFGDGVWSSLQNPVHDYTSYGQYDVYLSVWNDESEDNITKSKYIQVVPSVPPPSIDGDANGDCVVDFADLTILSVAYSTCEGDAAYDERADFNEDGCIDFSDLIILAANYGQSC